MAWRKIPGKWGGYHFYYNFCRFNGAIIAEAMTWNEPLEVARYRYLYLNDYCYKLLVNLSTKKFGTARRWHAVIDGLYPSYQPFGGRFNWEMTPNLLGIEGTYSQMRYKSCATTNSRKYNLIAHFFRLSLHRDKFFLFYPLENPRTHIFSTWGSNIKLRNNFVRISFKYVRL